MTLIEQARSAVETIKADLVEKNQMIDAGETHGADWGRREDDLGNAQMIAEDILAQLDRLEVLL